MKTVNITLKVNDSDLTSLESDLRGFTQVIDFRIVADTERLYKEDNTFKKLVKAKKELSNQILDYINKHN